MEWNEVILIIENISTDLQKTSKEINILCLLVFTKAICHLILSLFDSLNPTEGQDRALTVFEDFNCIQVIIESIKTKNVNIKYCVL